MSNCSLMIFWAFPRGLGALQRTQLVCRASGRLHATTAAILGGHCAVLTSPNRDSATTGSASAVSPS